MLFRLVRPVKRTGSRNRQFVRRIPSDVKSRAVGLKLSIPVGDETQAVIVTPRAQSVRLSLRTDDPAEVKVRLAQVDAYLENVWRALREDAPVSLTHRQATALAGELYRAWANGEGRERTATVEHDPEFKSVDDHIRRKGPTGAIEVTAWRRASVGNVSPEEWEAVLAHWDKVGMTENPRDLEKPLACVWPPAPNLSAAMFAIRTIFGGQLTRINSGSVPDTAISTGPNRPESAALPASK